MDPKLSKTPSIIDNVPNEIWVSILQSSIPKFYNDWRDAATVYESQWSVVVAMSQVCSRWRDLALATSSLWTRIVFRVRPETCYPNENLVSLFLERSKSQPLCVKLMLWKCDICPPKIQDCILEVLATIPRWKTGYVDIVQTPSPNLTPWYLIGPRLNASAPLLERLYIGVVFMDAIDVDTVLLPDKLWTTSARLAELYIDFLGDVWAVRDHVHGAPANPTQSQVSYNQLTHLRVASSRVLDGFDFSLAHILTILSRAPNLVSFFLQDSRRRPWSRVRSPGRKPVVLQYLKHLHLLTFGNKQDLLPKYLDLMVIAPSLETLTLSDTKNFDQASYTRFIDQSSCHLNELHLVNVEITAEVFLECMRLSPTLKVVHLSSIDALANADVCRAMAEWTDESSCFRGFNLVPKLQTLSLSNDPFSESVSHDVEKWMTEMLKSRLCPPDGSKGAFTTLAIPSIRIESPSLSLQEMCVYPSNLQLSANDGSYEDHRLWEVYGGQLW